METPILDFVRAYGQSEISRLHMPGHKGRGSLGFEKWDLTEVSGADALYEADGIIAQSEENAAQLFGTGGTLYSTEGSSQCIRAMLYLAQLCRGKRSGTVLAARNVHRVFVYAAALLDIQPVWLQSEDPNPALCSCKITPAGLEARLLLMKEPPAAVYVTSPDYLGNQLDIRALAEVCHRHNTLLLVDNAHGAYLHFLEPGRHPMDLGADICCDSAHKTLSALTGGAYLHLSKQLPPAFLDHAKSAMAMFGSTSPSYLILSSLDACNGELDASYRERLGITVKRIARLKRSLRAIGWGVLKTDPLKLTVNCASRGHSGHTVANALRSYGVECEFADRDYLVCMLTDRNPEADFEKLKDALTLIPTRPLTERIGLPALCPQPVVSIREALFCEQETIPVDRAISRICGAPTIGCPPAIPIVVSGERISAEAIVWMHHYGVERIRVLKNETAE